MSRLFLSRRSLAFAGLVSSALIMSGCASTPTSINQQDQTDVWAGRLSLQIHSEPAQAFFAGFELRGNAQQGELSLTSPIGSTLGLMRWSPGQATLATGGEIKRYSSTDELIEKSTGAAIPLSALFDWLRGTNTVLSGWTADLSRQQDGRIDATRRSPAPLTQLRIVLNQ
ncbi:outer membrane lipoprotein LolB [Polaromonas vacuolata]|uniref:outer membrane lipoprotein LolB n=1 Tax=Polaromonas vacuolata TaxID=37448 RepID=UPI001EE275CA|nr:outer membrane lipoprotein LolB [Polaromonas vacuolata]